jgi:hypothetical protein
MALTVVDVVDSVQVADELRLTTRHRKSDQEG